VIVVITRLLAEVEEIIMRTTVSHGAAAVVTAAARAAVGTAALQVAVAAEVEAWLLFMMTLGAT
jgi:hypothetical protein